MPNVKVYLRAPPSAETFSSSMMDCRCSAIAWEFQVTQKTTSENFFEQFCTQHGVRWEQIATDAAEGLKTPDYAIFPKGTQVIAEVKEVHENAAERQQRERLEKDG